MTEYQIRCWVLDFQHRQTNFFIYNWLYSQGRVSKIDYGFLPRQCGQNTDVVQMLVSFLQKCVSRAPDDSAIASELGYLLILQHKYKQAHKWYTKALSIDSCDNVAAISGTGTRLDT